MNQEDIKKKQKKVMIYVMLLCIVLAVGASYAYFTAGITSEDETTVTAEGGIMKINYNGGNTISLSGIYPRDEVWATKIITVTGNNTTDAEMYYKLNLVVDSNTFITSDPLQYELVSINTSNNGKVIPAISKTNLTSTSIELGKGNFLKADNAVHTYQLKIYYPLKDTDQNNNQGATFSAHVEITDDKGNSAIPAPAGWYEAKTGTLIATLRDNTEIKQTITVPGKEVSIASEALLASTEDDYGTSYYYRGAVDNNYVQFANKCWRIVRITGDGAIKLVLHNDNINKVSNPCLPVNYDEESNFAHYDFPYYKSRFNINNDDIAHIGFMYGTVGSSDYTSTHANINKSTILTNLETWYKNNLAQYEDKLADVIWCNDKYISYIPEDENGIVAFASGDRINLNQPSLKCSNDNNGGKLSKFTVKDTTYGNGNLDYKIGLLTVDELTYAGYLAYEESNNFLNDNNPDAEKWWAMSPEEFDYTIDTGPIIYTAGMSISDEYSGEELAIRPSIALVSTIEIIGTGTSEDPYIIN